MSPEDRKRHGAILAREYAAWSKEQADAFQPAADWASNEPTAYAEHADLLSSSPEAEASLFLRQTTALSEAGLLPSQRNAPPQED